MPIQKTLPQKYYLSHFIEFLQYVQGPSGHLLDSAHKDFIDAFEALPEDAQCLVVRAANRKHPIFSIASLYYEEITDTQENINLLFDNGFFRHAEDQDLPQLFDTMTRPEVVAQLKQHNVGVGLSSKKKHQLVVLASEQLTLEQVRDSYSFEHYCVRNFDQTLRYFLFLYFGDLSSRLNHFSMRDLGVMRTRNNNQKQRARFDTLDQATSAYFYASKLRQLNRRSGNISTEEIATFSEYPPAEGKQARDYRDEYLLKMGKGVLASDIDKGLEILSLSSHPEAQEKWLRESYKLGNKELVRQRLESITEQPESDHLLAFAEDFLARKFNKKRTSMLTDMLREGSQSLEIDEIYLNSIEHGVVEYYRGKGLCAYRTENGLWRALFGLTFWPLLFDADEEALANEFDRRPRALVDNDLYQRFGEDIDGLLEKVGSPNKLMAHLTAMATQYYGQANGIFGWHANLLELLNSLIKGTEISSLLEVLRSISKDFQTFSDGFPDIMVIDKGRARLEEVKGPGDQLRKNQLLTIRMLRQAGIDTRITQVRWCLDPKQPYAVVDIETTGGRANQHRIIEIGAVKVVDGEIVDEWQSLIQPGRHIPRAITHLTGIDDDMVRDAPMFEEIADSLRTFLQGSVFVAHNVNFDYGFIKHEYGRLEQQFSMPKLCTVREMRKAKPGLSSYSLANLTDAFNISMDRHHRAMDDAIAAAQLLFIVNQHRMSLSG